MNTHRMAVLACILTATTLPAMETVTFPAADGLAVTADLYLAHDKEAPFVILFHQAGYSRGEYGQIAPRLNGLGFNALAVDQRSGGAAKGVMNETAALARAPGIAERLPRRPSRPGSRDRLGEIVGQCGGQARPLGKLLLGFPGPQAGGRTAGTLRRGPRLLPRRILLRARLHREERPGHHGSGLRHLGAR